MTMAANPLVQNESGQSVMEFVFMLPLLLGLLVVLIRINSIVQVGIVNQQYARAQALTLAQNSPTYPRRDQVEGALKLVGTGNNQMILGVAEDLVLENPDNTLPFATKGMIARTKALAGSDSDEKEPAERGYVRVRNTVSLCTPSWNVYTNAGAKRADASTLIQGIDAKAFGYCNYNQAGSPAKELMP